MAVSVDGPGFDPAEQEPQGPRLSFVLTLALDGTGRPGNDLERASILFDSLLNFVRADDVDDVVVITRPADIAHVNRELAPYQDFFQLRVLSELDVCPPLAREPNTVNQWPAPNIGWIRQQLIKLACYRFVQTPFYMTLDSDVIFKKPLGIESLFSGAAANVNVETFDCYQALYNAETAEHERSVKRGRYRDAERVLGCTRPEDRKEFWYGETPVILACDIVEAMARRLEVVWGKPWEDALLEQLPWTEYPLYFSFAEASGMFDKYHRLAGADALLNLSQSLWWPADRYQDSRSLETWSVDRIFDPASPGVAVVIQSYLGHSPNHVRKYVGKYVQTLSDTVARRQLNGG